MEYVRSASGKTGKREIAKAFGIRGGPQRTALKALLADMTEEGLLAGGKRELRAPGELPPVTAIEVIATDGDGELIGQPLNWPPEDGPVPRVLIVSKPVRTRGGRSSIDRPLGEGDQILANISPATDAATTPEGISHLATPMKRLPRAASKLLGIYRQTEHGGLIAPVDKKSMKEWQVRPGDDKDAKDGDLVRFDIVRGPRQQIPKARVSEVLGHPEDQRQISLVAIHAHGIPDAFPEAVVDELGALPNLTPEGREDLTHIPLITIDPPDARDHDDAVHVERDTAPDNDGGAIVTVAIADVSFYVRAGTRLDREAQKRGNSCYFPDRVVPMLPELISNDLCSLREGELRPCLSVRIRIDKGGTKLGHTFHRGLMRVAKKLSYAEAQAVFDGFAPSTDPDGPQPATVEPLAGDPVAAVLADLWWGYTLLAKARDRRGPLDLDLPERKILLNDKGFVADIVIPDRLEANRLIEEFMIQANVAAAEMLEARKTPCVYRVHAPPSKEKLTGLRDFLDSLGMKLPASNTLKPKDINAILERAKSLPVPQLVSEVVLRSQSQAEYAVENEGHFGLNLRRYAHFTSPIRRYADLLVHRGLISALSLGQDGLRPDDHPGLGDTASTISDTERRAMAAERDTVDRLTAAFLAERVGATFKGRVSGVIKSGLFVRLDDTGADGYVPAASLGETEWFDHEESLHALIDYSSGKGYRLGDAVRVKLVEVAPMAGALRFEMVSDPAKISLALTKGYRGRGTASRPGRGRPQHRRRR